MGCRQVPTKQFLIQVARYEFTVKPLGALQSLRSGVPGDPFFNKISVAKLHGLYVALAVTRASVLSMLTEGYKSFSSSGVSQDIHWQFRTD